MIDVLPICITSMEARGTRFADAVYLFTADRNEKRVPRASIDVMQMGKTSIMPQGLDAALARDELRDLMAWLISLK